MRLRLGSRDVSSRETKCEKSRSTYNLLEDELHDPIFRKKHAQNNRAGSLRPFFVRVPLTVCAVTV